MVSSETGMPVARLMGLQETPDGIYIQIRWRGLSSKEDTLQPIGRVSEDVPQMLLRLLERKSIPAHLLRKAREAIAISNGVV